MKTMYRRNFHKIDSLFQEIDAARNSGVNITADRYPYIHTGTGLRMVLPPPWDSLSGTDLHNVLSSRAKRVEILRSFEESGFPEEGWNSVILTWSDFDTERKRQLFGLAMTEVAGIFKKSPAETCLDLLADDDNFQAAFGVLSEENLTRILQKDYVMAGSDGAGFRFDYSCGRGNPRDFGTFCEFFRRVSSFAPPQEAIRKMTSFPASVYRIPDRGVIRPGAVADLLVFDEKNYRARSTFAEPHRMCSGVELVVVAGKGAFSPEHPEKIGRHGTFIGV